MCGPALGVILDLDGTLVDHSGAVAAALEGWLPTYGFEASVELLEAWLAAEQRHFPAWRAGEISFTEQRRRRLRDFLPLIGVPLGARAGRDEQLDEIFAGYLSWYERSWRAFDDVHDTLEALTTNGLRLAVLTNGTMRQQHAKLQATDLEGRLGPIVTAEELGRAKPDPPTYLSVCSLLGLQPGRVVHVGDLYDLDVLAPRAAGLNAIHLDRTGAGPHHERHRISSLRELPTCISTLTNTNRP